MDKENQEPLFGDVDINKRLALLFSTIKTTHLKVGMIADTHFNIWQKSNRFFSHIEDMFNNFFKICKDEKVDIVFIAGDLFDAKQTVSTDGLIRVNKMIAQMAELCPVVIIPGNHDMAYLENAEINLASNYKRHENIVVIDKPASVKFSGYTHFFLPYSNNINLKIQELKKYIEKFPKEKHLLISHFGVIGFKVHEYSSDYANASAGEILTSDLAGFHHVFLGHYHGYQNRENITYISAPLQSRHGDEKSKHGFVTFDYKTSKHKFHVNENTPQFVTFNLTKVNAQKMLKLKNHYIRIKINKKVSKELLIKLRRKLMKNNFEIKTLIDIPEDVKFATIKGWKEIKFHDAESLIISYLKGLEKNKELKYNRKKLLSHIGIMENRK